MCLCFFHDFQNIIEKMENGGKKAQKKPFFKIELFSNKIHNSISILLFYLYIVNCLDRVCLRNAFAMLLQSIEGKRLSKKSALAILWNAFAKSSVRGTLLYSL